MTGWYEYPMNSWARIFVLALPLIVWSCAQSPYERGDHPAGFSRYDVERDYMECEYKARLANEQHFYSQVHPFHSVPDLRVPPTMPARCMAYRPSTPCGTPVLRQKATALISSGVQIAQILKPFAASILRDDHPFPSGIRQTNIGHTIEHKGLQ